MAKAIVAFMTKATAAVMTKATAAVTNKATAAFMTAAPYMTQAFLTKTTSTVIAHSIH